MNPTTREKWLAKGIRYRDQVRTRDGKVSGTYVSYFEKFVGDKCLVINARGHERWVDPLDLVKVS